MKKLEPKYPNIKFNQFPNLPYGFFPQEALRLPSEYAFYTTT